MAAGRYARPLLSALALSAFLAGCGGASNAPRTDDVFYLHGGGVIDKNRSWEVYFPNIDREKTLSLPRYVGVGVLDGDVRLARPIDWTVRDADYTAEKRFIAYQSPRQFTFAILERVDPQQDTWSQVLRRYELETRSQGARILAARQPVATANSQGRAYTLKVSVKGKPKPFDAYSTEILVRNNKRVVLVQVVHKQELDSIADEISAAVSSIIVY